MSLPNGVFEQVMALLPRDWVGANESSCAEMLKQLAKRRERVITLMREPVKYLAAEAAQDRR
jgi:DNA-binding transcriptional regulator PaaX